jgi:nucleoside-diphosphate-sugar epimerase
MSLKVLFIGGSGIISSACSQIAVVRGMQLFVYNRGISRATRPIPDGVNFIRGDLQHPQDLEFLLHEHKFDVVVNWIAYQPKDIVRDIDLFRGKVRQYIFISSASVYQKPIRQLPITEETPLENPYWDYAQAKIACERRLLQAHRDNNFPCTIVRPSHTYDKTLFPFRGGYTVLDRMKKGKEVIIHGDGTSIWVLTHHYDFAQGFVGLIGHESAIGEAFHITSNFLLTWNEIYQLVGEAAGVEVKPCFVPSNFIARHDPSWGASLLGDKSHSVIFDNSKIKEIVPGFRAKIPFSLGSKEVVDWHEEDISRQSVDQAFSKMMDDLIEAYAS